MIVDLIIIVLVISAIFRGKEIGFVQQILSTIGFFGGLILGTYLLPLTLKPMHTALSRSIVTLLTTLGMAIIMLSLFEIAGVYAKKRVARLAELNRFDNILGAVISAISIVIGVWLGVAIIRTLPYSSFQQDINDSKIVGFLDQHLPPAPNIIADLSHLIDPNGFPKVFNGNEPAPPGSVNLPAQSKLAAAVSADRTSVVKIVGSGCGGVVEGSGFVVSSDLVATNAHVVAGISLPYVEDANGNHLASVIYFNPNLDFALLRVSHLAGKPLSISSGIVPNKTPAAVLGYPGGGSFTVDPAAVLAEFLATGSNIYGKGTTNRQVYELQANIIPGNSGGPLINVSGSVIGVVFAESTEYNHVGYALVTKPIVTIVNSELNKTSTVSTGNCAM